MPILEAILEYAENGGPASHFVTAVLENDLTEAVFRADSKSLAGLADIVRFVHHEIPHSCHGSREKVLRYSRLVGNDG